MSDSSKQTNVPGTNSPPVDATSKNPLGETGDSKPISDQEQRGDQFGEKKAQNIESGEAGSDISKAAEAAKATADKYASK